MYNKAKKQVWYGELRTAKGNTVVIFDGSLPEASPGRVYFYHSGRDAIIEFVEDIVNANLHDLDSAQTAAAKDEFESVFQAARSAFLAAHPSRLDLSTVPDSAPATKAKAKPIEEEAAPEPVDDYEDSDDADEDIHDMGDNLDDMD
ncbi:hypothetical protein [Shewanella maritima]|uniref:hypothetical protein n=1 Tax=Shewanella maritima TaxID=2520507 RepID=UPI003736E5CF